MAVWGRSSVFTDTRRHLRTVQQVQPDGHHSQSTNPRDRRGGFNPVSSNPHDHTKKLWWSHRKRSFIVMFPERKIRRMSWLNSRAWQHQCWFCLYLWIYSPLALSIKPSHQWRTSSNFLSCKQGRRQKKKEYWISQFKIKLKAKKLLDFHIIISVMKLQSVLFWKFLCICGAQLHFL